MQGCLTKCLVGTVLLLSGCTIDASKLDSIEFNDTILSHSYQEKYGVATGLLNIYVVYGKWELDKETVPAGVCLTPQGFKRYKVEQLLQKYPELKVPDGK